jgi:hypothetical protein
MVRLKASALRMTQFGAYRAGSLCRVPLDQTTDALTLNQNDREVTEIDCCQHHAALWAFISSKLAV